MAETKLTDAQNATLKRIVNASFHTIQNSYSSIGENKATLKALSGKGLIRLTDKLFYRSVTITDAGRDYAIAQGWIVVEQPTDEPVSKLGKCECGEPVHPNTSVCRRCGRAVWGVSDGQVERDANKVRRSNVQNRAADNGESSEQARKSVKKSFKRNEKIWFERGGTNKEWLWGYFKSQRNNVVHIEVGSDNYFAECHSHVESVLTEAEYEAMLAAPSEPAAAQTADDAVSEDEARVLGYVCKQSTPVGYEEIYWAIETFTASYVESLIDRLKARGYISDNGNHDKYTHTAKGYSAYLAQHAAQTQTANEAGTGDMSHAGDGAIRKGITTLTDMIERRNEELDAKDATIAALQADNEKLRAALEEMKVWIRKADVNVQPIRLVIEPMIDKALAKLKGEPID